MWAKTSPDLQRCEDPSDRLEYMLDIRDDHRGFERHWIRCRAACQQGLAVPLNHPCGVSIAVEGLGGVPLLSIPVRHQHVDPVCLCEERVGHSNLVSQRMVGIKVQISVCVGLFTEHRCGQGSHQRDG